MSLIMASCIIFLCYKHNHSDSQSTYTLRGKEENDNSIIIFILKEEELDGIGEEILLNKHISNSLRYVLI